MVACQNGHLDIVEFLLAQPQVDVNAKNKVIIDISFVGKSWILDTVVCTQEGVSALMYACYGGKIDVIQMLLKHPKVDVNGKSDVGSSTPPM